MSLSLPFKRESQDPEIRPLSKKRINMASSTRSSQPPALPGLVRAINAPEAPFSSDRRGINLHPSAAWHTRGSDATYSARADDIICRDPSQCPYGPEAGLHSFLRHGHPHSKKKVKCADKTVELLRVTKRSSGEPEGEVEDQTRPDSTSKRREPVVVWMNGDTGMKMESPKEAVRVVESYCRTKFEEGEAGSQVTFGPYHRSLLETMIQDIPVAPESAQKVASGTRAKHGPPPPLHQEKHMPAPCLAGGGRTPPRNPVTEQTEAEKRKVLGEVMFQMANHAYYREKESNPKQPVVDMQREGVASALNSQEHFRQAAETARKRLQEQKLRAKKAQEEEELKKEALRRKEFQRQEFEQQNQQQQREYQLKHDEARTRKRTQMEERITRHLEREAQMKQQEYELEQKQRQEDFSKQRPLEKHQLEMKQRQEFQLKQKQQQKEYELQEKQQQQDYVGLMLKKQQECNLEIEKLQDEERQKLQQKQAELQRQEEQAKQRQREEYQLQQKQQQQQQQQDLERRKKASQELRLKQQQRHEALLKSKQELEALQSGVRQREAELMQKQRQEYEFKERQKREEQKRVQLKRQAEYEAKKQQIEASDVSSKPVYNPEQGYADMIEMIKNWQLSATKGIHSISEELGRISATAAKAEEQIERDAVSAEVRPEPEAVAKAAEASKAPEVEADREIPPFSLGYPLSPVIDPHNRSRPGANPSQGMMYRLVKKEDDVQTFEFVSHEDAQDPVEEFIIAEPMNCCENGKNCENCDCQKSPQAGIARALPLEFFDDDFLLI
ncbi:hypothetical protein CaCOL14_010429 [Colletotrichum acutatum]